MGAGDREALGAVDRVVDREAMGALDRVGDRQVLRAVDRVGEWEVRRAVGRAGDLHARSPWQGGASRRIWFCECTAPALVLGSVQSVEQVDLARAAAAGVEVVRRRSGGGAVLVVPGSTAWVEVDLPQGDRLWEPDVGRAFGWLGRAWAGALDSLGLGPAAVHSGPLLAPRWSERVCFLGLGPGEVSVEGRKVLGMAQRRSRQGAVFSCAAYLELDGAALADLLALDLDDRTQVAGAIEARAASLAPGVTLGEVESALLAFLP